MHADSTSKNNGPTADWWTHCEYNMTLYSPCVSGAGPAFCPAAGSLNDLGFTDVV